MRQTHRLGLVRPLSPPRSRPPPERLPRGYAAREPDYRRTMRERNTQHLLVLSTGESYSYVVTIVRVGRQFNGGPPFVDKGRGGSYA